MYQVKQSEATAARRRIPVLFVSSTDGFTPVTPTSPVAYLSANGATWVASTNSVAVATLAAGQSAAGVYYLELTATEVANLGWITVNVQATNARQYNAHVQVMAYDPYDVVRIGLTSIPNVAQGSAGALPIGNATGQVTVGTNADKTGYSLTQAFPTNFASMAITAGGAVTAGTVSDKTGYSLTQTFPTNFSSLAITVGGAVTAGTVSDKTGYSLTQAFPANFSSMAITAGGAVTAGTVSDKTGYSLATAPPTAAAIATQVWSEALPGTYTSGQAGFKLNAAGSAADPWSTALPGAYSAGSAGNIIGNMVANTWSAGTRTLTAGTNIVLSKGTGITGFNDITSQSVWDVLASTVSVTGSIGLQLKTNINATVSSRMATFTYTEPPTAASISSTVWGDQVASYVNTGSFGYRLLRSDATSHSGDVYVQGNGSANNHNRIDSDMHAIDGDHTAATNLKGLLPVAGKVAGTVTGIENITFPTNFSTLAIQTGTGYVTATNGGGGGGASTTVRPGPFMLMAGNAVAGTPLDVQKGSVASISLQCVDGNSTGIDLTGATVSTKVYNTAGTLIATYTNTASYSADGHTLCPLDATVTGTSGTYTANVWAVNGSTTTIYGPLRIYVRDI